MAIESQGTIIEIETGAGVAKNISDITLGAITKVTSAAHGRSVGDVVTISGISGTTQLNGVTAMVIAAEADSLFFKIDSSGYGAYTSGGTITPVAYTAIGEIVDWSGPGGSASVIDATHLGSVAKEKMIGLMDEGQFTFSLNNVFSDVGQQALRASRSARTKKGYRITYSDNTVQTFNGYCLSFSTSGGVDGKVEGSVTIEITGAVATA